MILVQGKGVSTGIAMGPLYFWQRAKTGIARCEVEDTDAEWARFKAAQSKAIEQLAQTEGVPVEVLDRFLSEYDYLQKQKPEIIQEAVREQHLGLSKTRKAVKRILAALTNIINIFNWD